MTPTGVTMRLSADTPATEIVLGVRLAPDGKHVLVSVSPRPAGMGSRSPRSRPPEAIGTDSLTRREREVLSLLSRGQKNAEIARALQISPQTARTHAKRVYRKLGVNSRGELLGMEL